MINSIKAYDSNIRIGLWLPPTRALYANTNRFAIDTSLRMNQLLIDTYDGHETDKLYLVPVYLNVDPEHDYNSNTVQISERNDSYTMIVATDAVHPSAVGYKKIADVLYSYIKYFATL
jgi:lysophospholipase L1-like esterase